MEQVEAVPLPYEPRPRPKPLLKKKELRQSNRQRLDETLIVLMAFAISGFLTPTASTSLWLAASLSSLIAFAFAVELFFMVQRYRLAAERWMARPGERRILKYNLWLRVLAVMPSRDATIQSAAVFQPAVKNLDRKQDQLRMTLALRFLQAIIILICLAISCVGIVKPLLQNFSQNPVSSTVKLILLAVMVVIAVGLAAGLVTAGWRQCRPSSSSPFFQSWIEYWGLRVESFEMPRINARH